MNKFKFGAVLGALSLLTICLVACTGCKSSSTSGGSTGGSTGGGSTATNVSGTMNIDGSGTVYPVAAGLVEVFNESNPEANITVGKSGTGGGMSIFAKGETDIANASRPIKSDEIEELEAAGIEFIEVPIAYDGVCIVVHPDNDFASEITIDQLHRVWDAAREGEQTKWSDLDPSWPDRAIKLYGPTSAHGTYEYFNEVVNGEGDVVRQDYSQQSEYEPLITGVSNEPDALGYVGFAYYDKNKDKLKALTVKTDAGSVAPSKESIADGTYVPFSRPLMMYVKKSAYESNPVTKAYIDMIFTEDGSFVIDKVGYVPLPGDVADLVKARLSNLTTGSVLNGAESGASLTSLLSN